MSSGKILPVVVVALFVATALSVCMIATDQNDDIIGIDKTSGNWTDVDSNDRPLYVDLYWYNNSPTSTSYTLNSSAQLAGLAFLNNVRNVSFAGRTITLDATVTYNLSAHYWTPIGTQEHPFLGTIKGSAAEIKNMNINNTDDYNGFVGYLGKLDNNIGTLMNVVITDANMKGGLYIGGLAGYSIGIVESCYFEGMIDKPASDAGGIVGFNVGLIFDCGSKPHIKSGGNFIGGIVGWNDLNGVVQLCRTTKDNTTYYANIQGDNAVGGIAGVNYGRVESSFVHKYAMGGNDSVGGIVGENVGSVKSCFFDGGSNGSTKVGGIVGHNFTGTVTGCYVSNHKGDTTLMVAAREYAGGIVGYNQYGSILQCYFIGKISADKGKFGTICGNTNDGVWGCYGTNNGTGMNLQKMTGEQTHSTMSALFQGGDQSLFVTDPSVSKKYSPQLRAFHGSPWQNIVYDQLYHWVG